MAPSRYAVPTCRAQKEAYLEMARSSEVVRLSGRGRWSGSVQRGVRLRVGRGPLVNSMQEALAEQGAGAAEDMRRDHGILRVQLPDEGHCVRDFFRAAEGTPQRGPDTEVFFGDAVNDSVSPSLELFASTAWGSDVASLRDVDCRPACVREAPVTNATGGDEVWWRWWWRCSRGSSVVCSGRGGNRVKVAW